MKQYNTTHVTSHNQAGGQTTGVIAINNLTNNTFIWKYRKEGFAGGIITGVIVEFIIRLIF